MSTIYLNTLFNTLIKKIKLKMFIKKKTSLIKKMQTCPITQKGNYIYNTCNNNILKI